MVLQLFGTAAITGLLGLLALHQIWGSQGPQGRENSALQVRERFREAEPQRRASPTRTSAHARSRRCKDQKGSRSIEGASVPAA